MTYRRFNKFTPTDKIFLTTRSELHKSELMRLIPVVSRPHLN